MKFAEAAEFQEAWARFWDAACGRRFEPRQFILENLTLEKSAVEYLRQVESVEAQCR